MTNVEGRDDEARLTTCVIRAVSCLFRYCPNVTLGSSAGHYSELESEEHIIMVKGEGSSCWGQDRRVSVRK